MSETYTILIAEDNDVSRELMTKVLEGEGYKILQARDGGEAMGLMGKQEVHMALVDLHMAPKGGFEFISYLHTKNYTIPVVVVTGDKGTDLLIEARKHGVQQLLQKPVEPERLIMMVERVIQRAYGE